MNNFAFVWVKPKKILGFSTCHQYFWRMSKITKVFWKFFKIRRRFRGSTPQCACMMQRITNKYLVFRNALLCIVGNRQRRGGLSPHESLVWDENSDSKFSGICRSQRPLLQRNCALSFHKMANTDRFVQTRFCREESDQLKSCQISSRICLRWKRIHKGNDLLLDINGDYKFERGGWSNDRKKSCTAKFTLNLNSTNNYQDDDGTTITNVDVTVVFYLFKN